VIARSSAPLLGAMLAATALALGCGGDDDGDGGGEDKSPAPAAATATTSPDARIEKPEGERIAEVALELLNAEDGDEPCYAIVASDYVESLGGLEGCAKELGPVATGPLDTVTAARPLGDGETGEARAESSDGSQKQTIEFAKTAAGEWRVDGLGGS
jgi:hypothetical protein